MWADRNEMSKAFSSLQYQLLQLEGNLEASWTDAWETLKQLKEG